MRALGYEHEHVYLNSMVCWPTPQSRDRLYVVFWLKGMRAPDLRFEPSSWCPSCEKIVDGRQTWKRPGGSVKLGRVWGRYGPQYFYTCPVCHGPVLPAVFPAASIIDRPLEAIGRQDARADPSRPRSTSRRSASAIRLAREPFAIRLMRDAPPKPLTLPVVTLTQRHDMAMVAPVAGHTFERTPGNRARDARLVPLDTVHTTLDRAVIVPLRRNVEPRFTHEPIGTICASGGHQTLVMRNNESRGDAGQMCTPAHEPVRTFTTSGHQSVVIPYNRTGTPRPDSQPTTTLSTRDRLALVVPVGGTWADAATPEHEPLATQTPRNERALVYTEDDIDACLFRMFALHEIAGAMVMADHTDGSHYIVTGNKREQMAQYGNAVTPPAARELIRRVMEIL
jgi:DNA (cytosine-5)-methyltransferase 1